VGMYDSGLPNPNEISSSHDYVVNERISEVVGNTILLGSPQPSSLCGVKSIADKSRRNKNTRNDGWTAPPLCGYFENAQKKLRNSNPSVLRHISRTTEAVRDNHQLSPSKASTAPKGRGMKDCFRALPSHANGEKDVNSRQDSSQPLSSSWDDTEAKLASNKRKTDAMMNLTDNTCRRVRNRPVVASGTKGHKQRRQTTEPRQSRPRSRESRLPLAPLTAETFNPPSLMKQGKMSTSHSKKSSPDTIVVPILSSIESVAPPPKRRRRGTQSRKGVETYLWR
jgi:hypothetical protein